MTITKSTTNTNNNNNNLECGDVVEFVMSTCKRTGRKYARDIILIESMDERVIRTASLEQGIVVSNKGDFGFLRSTTRVEEIYFHISHMVTTNDDDDDDKDNKLKLEEGQEMEFYVINDSNGGIKGRGKGGGGSGSRYVARRIRPLSKGTVKFEHVIAEGVTGLVIECPTESSSSSSNDPFGDRRRGDRGGSSSSNNTNNGDGRSRRGLVVGMVRLIDEVHDEANEMHVVEVSLPLEAYPCGTFAINRTGTEVGSWIRPGDILLFDVVRRTVDGAYLAMPTKYARKPPPPPPPRDSGVDDIVNSDDRAIRLIAPSLCGRAEGVIKSVHDNYGFISLAERNVDAYFPFFEMLPLEIQRDLARNNCHISVSGAGEDVDGFVRNNRLGGRIHPEVGMEVSFDLSLQLLSTTTGSGGRSYSNNNRQGKEERESLRARRICILPKGTVKDKILVASCVSARVSREDPKQPFAGMLELDEQVKVGCETQRHPLVSRLIDEISNGKYGQEEVTFHDILSEADRRVVIAMVEARDDLEWNYVGPNNNDSSADTSHHKLRIARKKVGSIHDPISRAVEASISGEIVDNPLDGQESRIELVDEGNASSMEVANHAGGSNQKKKGTKSIKSIRYDRSAFTDLSGGSLVAGDILTCDVVVLRRTGMVVVENINVIERVERSAIVVSDGDRGKENTTTQQRLGLTGFVSKFEPSRQFGFITVVDENGLKTGEHIFFHSKEIEYCSADDVQDGDSQPTRSKKPPRGDVIIGKGDEVKFDVGPGKNGKMNATNILVLPRGTIQIQTNSTDTSMSCTGYVLIEPAYTSLVVNTAPSTIASQSSEPVAGRWANVRDDKTKTVTSVKEGKILLLSDPSHLFSPHIEMDSPEKQKITGSEVKSPKDVAQDVKVESTKDSESQNSTQSVVGTHLEYKLSSLAVRGYMNGGVGTSSNRSDAPKRGDLVSFSKTRGARLLKDVRVEKMGAATFVTGTLIELDIDNDTAIFVSSENDVRYEINLMEVVSCDKLLLKDNEQVDGILHEGKIYGVCRTKDVSLSSSFGNSRDSSSSGMSIGTKERPKLNLTVKKELQGMGGQIMAQSRMAKGPDGTNGFDSGWTRRVSLHMKDEEDIPAAMDNSLSASASEFVPSFSIATSGFEPIEADE
jgi:cold shock CspA family protein